MRWRSCERCILARYSACLAAQTPGIRFQQRAADHDVLNLGGAVAEVLAELGKGRLVRLGLEDEFVMDVLPYPAILEPFGLNGPGIAAAARSLLG